MAQLGDQVHLSRVRTKSLIRLFKEEKHGDLEGGGRDCDGLGHNVL